MIVIIDLYAMALDQFRLIRKALEERATNTKGLLPPSQVSTKESVTDLVTDTDRACEKLIVETLKKAYPVTS